MISAESSLNKISRILILSALFTVIGCSLVKKSIKPAPEPIIKPIKPQPTYSFVPEAVDHVILASVYEVQGDYIRALYEYNQALLQDSSSLTLFSKTAENYQRLGEFDSARLLLQKAIRSLGEKQDLLWQLGEVLFELQRYDESLNIFYRLVTLYPDDRDGWFNLAALYIRKGEQLKAVECYDQVLRLEGPNIEIMIRQATLLSMMKKIPEAIQIYENMRAWQPEDSQIPFTIGGLYLQLNDTTRADSMFVLASTLAPEVARYWMVQSQIAVVRGDTSSAIQRIEAGLSHNPDDLELLSLAGTLYMRCHKFDLAEPVLLHASELDTDGVLHLINLGFLYHEKKHWDKAEECYLKALKIDPQDPQLLNNFAYMLAEKGERFEEALLYVNAALETEPESASYLDTKGWLLFLMGKREEAREYLEKAGELVKDNPEILDHLGELYKAFGDYDRARDMWTRAMEHGGDESEIREKLEGIR